jgi:hypothetical protein
MKKQKTKSILRNLLYRFRQIVLDRYYHFIMRKAGIPNKEVPGEKEWMEKWSVFGLNPKTVQYRVCSHFLGNDINIVPEDICHDFIETILNPPRFRDYYSDKNIYDKLFPAGYLPRTILRKINGMYHDEQYKLIEMSEQRFSQILEKSGVDRIVIKPSVGGQSGIGVRLFYKTTGTATSWRDVTTDELLNLTYLDKNYGPHIIIQEAVTQSDFLSQFNPSSANTLRLALYRSVSDNECHIVGAFMRIGGKGSVVDNTHAGGYFIGIQPDGTFCHEVCNQFGQLLTTFNDIDFTKDYHYPKWDEVTDFAKSVGKYILHHRLLALDIILDKNDKPHLIEYNIEGYSVWGYQFTNSCALGHYTDEIIDYCKEHQNEIEEIVHL